MRRHSLAAAIAFVVSMLAGTGAAQAVVVDQSLENTGVSSVQYSSQDLGNYAGVAMMPGAASRLAAAQIPTVTTPGTSCWDPALTADMFLPQTGLCYHSGTVIHKSETFALVWDPGSHRDWTAAYLEQFLRDVADGSASNPANPGPSGNMTSPFAVLPQYTDGGGRALYDSLYGGGYDDPRTYPSPACPVSGNNPFFFEANAIATQPNDVCMTDAQIKSELQAMVPQEGIQGRFQSGYTPLFVVLLPPGVEVCLDNAGHLCSANSSDGTNGNVPGTSIPAAQFCSYHSQVFVGGQPYQYVVQPMTAYMETKPTDPFGCDEPNSTLYPNPVPIDQLTNLTSQRLASPLSAALMAATVNPQFNGWFALDGSEINDNGGLIGDNPFQTPGQGCSVQGGIDTSTVGSSGQNPYFLQREFNNGGAIVQDPYALPCSGGVALQPMFVVPSPINAGDVVEFDGFRTPTTLLVPRANFQWDFGDGTFGAGPNAVHSFAKGGTYAVKLTVVDRGGNKLTTTEGVTVLGSNGQPPPPPKPGIPALKVRMQLIPQALKTMLSSGLRLRVTSNLPANGIVMLSIPRSAAKRAHIRTGSGASVVIGRGTVAAIKNGTVSLRLRLSKLTAKRLRHVGRLTVTVRIALVAKGVRPVSIVAAGRY